jgi:hypothetical protein
MVTDGVGGSTVMLDNVGFGKNPVQLTVMTTAASAPKATARRDFCSVDDMAS